MGIKEQLVIFLEDLSINTLVAELIVTFIMILIWLFIAVLVIKLFKRVSYRILKIDKKSPRTLTIGRLINSIFRYFVWFIVFIFILDELNIDITPFIASAGVIGLAIGFGAQEIVKDFISGFFIIFEGLFDVGDVVEVDGFKGNVKSLGLRTTTITNWKGEVKSVNNGDIRSLINYSKNDSLAIIEFGVAYDTNLDILKKLMDEFTSVVHKRYEDIIEEPKFLGINNLGDSSIDMIMIAKTKNNQHHQLQRELRRDLIQHLDKNEVEVPFPHVVVKNEKN